jgi:hypothetical protein
MLSIIPACMMAQWIRQSDLWITSVGLLNSQRDTCFGRTHNNNIWYRSNGYYGTNIFYAATTFNGVNTFTGASSFVNVSITGTLSAGTVNNRIYLQLPSLDSTLLVVNKVYFLGYTPVTLHTDTIYIEPIVNHANVSIVGKLWYGVNINTTGTAIVSSPGTVTATTTITKVSTFSNGTIPAGNSIWVTFPTITTKPRSISIAILGH